MIISLWVHTAYKYGYLASFRKFVFNVCRVVFLSLLDIRIRPLVELLRGLDLDQDQDHHRRDSKIK